MRGVKRTRPAEKAKEKVTEARGNTGAREDSEAKEHNSPRRCRWDEDEEDERGPSGAQHGGRWTSHPQATLEAGRRRMAAAQRRTGKPNEDSGH